MRAHSHGTDIPPHAQPGTALSPSFMFELCYHQKKTAFYTRAEFRANKAVH